MRPPCLEISYRCPPDVTELARRNPRRWRIGSGRPDSSTVCAQFPSECHQAEWLTRELSTLQTSDPLASAALILSARPSQRGVCSSTCGAVWPCGWRWTGDYQFVGGLNVTSVQEPRAWSSTYVLIPDASAAVYPATPAGRRALYVAVTARLTPAGSVQRGSVDGNSAEPIILVAQDARKNIEQNLAVERPW